MARSSHRLISVLTVTGLALALTAPPLPAEAGPDDGPTLALVGGDPGTPVQADASDDFDTYPSGFTVAFTSDRATTVTVTASASGLTPDPATQSVAVGAGARSEAHLSLDDPQPGVHALTITLSAPGATSVNVTYPYLFTPGAEAVPGGDSLAGRVFEHTDTELYSESHYDHEDYEVWFVDGTWAYVGKPTTGRPTCTHTDRYGHGCQPYHYDAATGIVEVSSYIIGRVDRTHAFFVGADAAEAIGSDDDHPGYADFTPLVAPSPGARLQGRWAFHAGTRDDDLHDVVLRLHRDGTYRLTYVAAENLSATTRRLAGRYRVLTRGRVLLHHRVVVRHRRPTHRTATQLVTLLEATTLAGRPEPTRAGVWLGLRYRFEKYAYDESAFLAPSTAA